MKQEFVPEHIFQNMYEKGVTSGAFLFISNSKEYLKEQALLFAEELLDYEPAMRPLNEKIYRTETDLIPVEIVEDFIVFEKKVAVRAKSKILIMHDVELLRPGTADKLLKTIEELNKDSFVVFTTTNASALLNTIRSRCQVYTKTIKEENYFVTFKNKYLAFMPQVKEAEKLADLQPIISAMGNLGVLNVIQAMLHNLSDKTLLGIAREAAFLYKSSSKEEQIITFIIYSVFLFYKGAYDKVVTVE